MLSKCIQSGAQRIKGLTYLFSKNRDGYEKRISYADLEIRKMFGKKVLGRSLEKSTKTENFTIQFLEAFFKIDQ
jgi:hypothetical protein